MSESGGSGFSTPHFPTYGMDNLTPSNNYPTDDEACYIRDVALPKANSDLDAVVAQLEALTAKYHIILEAHTSLRTMIGPFRRIPSDIWLEIFSYFVLFRTGETVPKPQCTLMEVCTTWRTVVIESKALWSRIVVLAQSEGEFVRESDSRFIAYALRRSREHPLTIVLDETALNGFTKALDPNVNGMLPSLYALLLSQSHRWARAELRLVTSDSSMLFLENSQNFHALADLTLSLSRYIMRGLSTSSGIQAFKDAPCLRRVTLSDCFYHHDTYPLHIDWPQIQALSVDDGVWMDGDDTVPATFEMLARCTSLRQLTVTAANYTFTSGLHRDLVVALPITSLRSSFPFLISRLVVPHLEEAVIFDQHKSVNDAFPAFVTMITGSKCYLSLTRIECSKPDFIDAADFQLLPILRETKNLEILVLLVAGVSDTDPSVGFDAEMVEIIDRLSDADSFLPKLQSFELDILAHGTRDIFPYFGEESHLVAALRARVSRLWNFRIHADVDAVGLGEEFLRKAGSGRLHDLFLSADELDDLEALRRDGLRVHLSVTGGIVGAVGVARFRGSMLL